MKVEFLDKFNKDLTKIKNKAVSEDVLATIENVEQSFNIASIKNIKKLKGFKNAYRIRIGNYRIGIFVTDDAVEFVRIVHRKDIYNLFP
ncbi:type II toxin-antitoxin system RelE family toxin [Mucilaginibacter arboris]|uniref:Type II toxin-antitoxin system RelE/ParE family toxin n=1 Tax=Mucilaginibacter arboris TaxID=2682090 RepID=A0A7K1T1F0_9SPHI|nr:type II toxin-antitoxin system RelE/ParE family toxin [Mucilaginibacter arboris]MVN23412.1 type II toxin-antitoxin system RelE/ParE family toxin [Mucilaginibacter arboris]